MTASARSRPLGLLLVFVCAGLGAALAEPLLRVSDVAAGRVLLELPLGEAPTWVVEWNHSVTGILVSDYYRYTAGRMVLTDSHAPAFDAGLGHIPGRGRLESDGAHGYWIRGIDEPVPGNAYLLRVGSPRVDHRIVHAGRSYSLSALAAGRRVRLEVVAAEERCAAPERAR